MRARIKYWTLVAQLFWHGRRNPRAAWVLWRMTAQTVRVGQQIAQSIPEGPISGPQLLAFAETYGIPKLPDESDLELRTRMLALLRVPKSSLELTIPEDFSKITLESLEPWMPRRYWPGSFMGYPSTYVCPGCPGCEKEVNPR